MSAILPSAFPGGGEPRQLPGGPAVLICGMVSGEGFIRALLTLIVSLERELFLKEVGARKRKCLSSEPHLLQSFVFIQEPLTRHC